jgi:predicted PurR-regulated permease PerM
MALREKIESAGQALSRPTAFQLPTGLLNIGLAAWLFVGAVAALLIIAAFFVLAAGITVPLILAAVIGMVSFPLAARLQRKGASPTVAALVILVGLGVIIGVTVWITIAGVVQQWPTISQNIQAGVDELAIQAAAVGISAETVEQAADQVTGAASSVMSGFVSSLFSSLASGLSGIFGLFFGIFISVTLLYYILHDFDNLADWVGGHIGLPKDLGDGVVADAVDAMQGYFRGTTLTGLAVATVIGGAALLLSVPLALPIALVTFVTCYIPYFGAIFSGAFAFIIALSAGGITKAVLMLVIVLIAQNVLQTVISARFMGESLSLHPIVVLVVTMLGGTFAGLLGAALAAPLTALGTRTVARLEAYDAAGLLDEGDEHAAA